MEIKPDIRDNIHEGLRDLFVPYTIAWHLQHPNPAEHKTEFVFDVECIAFWNHYQELNLNHTYELYGDHLKAPTYQQVLDWFRKKYEIGINITCGGKLSTYQIYTKETLITSPYSFPDYYEAFNKAIIEAFKQI